MFMIEIILKDKAILDKTQTELEFFKGIKCHKKTPRLGTTNRARLSGEMMNMGWEGRTA